MKQKTVSLNIISKIFHTKISNLDKNTKNLIKKYKLKYEQLIIKDRKILKKNSFLKIKNDKQKIARPYRKKIWYDGWQENYNEFKKTKNLKSIIPKYYTRKNINIFRLGGKFVRSYDSNFELKLLDIYRNWFLRSYFKKCSNIYEFGVGSGNNIISASKIFPKKNFYGLDFVKSSVNLINLIGKKQKNISGVLFDMNKPNYKLKISKNSGFFSIGALEQLNDELDNILNFFIKKAFDLR